MTPDATVAVARSWLDTPYQHQASLKGIATDCIGLIAGVAAELGVAEAAAWANDPRRRSYASSPDVPMLKQAAEEFLERVPDGAGLHRGDVVMMRFRRDPKHFAIVTELEPARIVHAYSSAGRVVENDMRGIFALDRVVAVFRYRGA